MVVRELIARLGFTVDRSSMNQASASISNTKESMDKLGSSGLNAGAQASTGLGMIGTAANLARGMVIGLGFAIVEAIKVAVSGSVAASDEMQNLNGRLAVVIKSEKERLDVERQLFDTANRARQPLAETGDLFFKIAKASDELGTSQQDALQMTETVAKALTVGGAGAAQSQATILQLGQALGSGVLQGDELRSLNENATDLMQAIAKYFGTTVAGLRKMGKDGELTADKVAQAILSSKKVIDEQFEKMPLTVEQAMVMTGNAFKQGVFEFERQTGAFSTIAHAIVSAVKGITNNIIWLTNKFGGTKRTLTLFAVGLGIISAALVAIKFGPILAGIRSMVVAMRAFAIANAAIMLKFVLIAAVIAIVVLAIQDLYTWINGGDSLLGRWLGSWEDFKEKSRSFFEPLIYIFNELASLFQRAWTQILMSIAIMSPQIDEVKEQFARLWVVVAPILQMIGKFLIYIIGGAIEFVILIIGWLIQQFLEIVTTGGYVADAIVVAFRGMAKMLESIISFVTNIMRGNFLDACNDVTNFFWALGDTIIGILKDIAMAIGTYIVDKISWAKDAIFDFLGWSTDTTAKAINDSRTNYNQNISISQQFQGGTAAENMGYMQDGAVDAYSDLGVNLQYGD